jgi:hypothetical protein
MTKEISGIKAALFHKLLQKGNAELVETTMKAYELAGEKFWQLDETKEALASKEVSIKKRNAAGANAKAKRYQPKKNKVSELYGALKSANGGKNPALKVLLNELERACPTEDWAADTISDWHKKLNKGLTL